MRAFSLNGPGMKPVRQAVHRLQRRGYTTRVQPPRRASTRHGSTSWTPPPPAGAGTAATSAGSRWRWAGSVTRWTATACWSRRVTPRATLRGFLSFVPWGRNGLSLDLMRRDPSADNGLVELMVSSLAERAGAFGVARVSLNFAMFREAFERGAEIGAGPIARLWRQALVLASRNWQLESLYRSNAKYLPEWQPRFICFEYASDLPRVGMAAGNAEGFLTRPSLSLLRRTGAEAGCWGAGPRG